MMLWLFRIFVIAASPTIVYFQISRTPAGAAVGLAVGLVIVGAEILIEDLNLLTMISAMLGGALGIIMAKLLDYIVFQIGNDALYAAWDKYSLLRYFALGALGAVVAVKKFPEFDQLDKDLAKMGRRRGADMKILDAGSIIDGRIVDVCDTHFLSGSLIVPRFVLHDLQVLADSEDAFKRARGRRGLDILARLQENGEVPVKIMDRDPDAPDVDAKLVRLARDLGAKLVTTDFNLNKAAMLEGVVCLNVNDLSTALKPVVLPGESMPIFVMKDGKEKDQGVGYLDDGTMVVVEDGRRWIGKRIDIAVTSILQTSAGRMVFGKSRGEKV